MLEGALTLFTICNPYRYFVGQACRVAPQKNWHIFVLLITSSHIDQGSNLFHCQNQEKNCNNTIMKDPTTPQVCRYTTL